MNYRAMSVADSIRRRGRRADEEPFEETVEILRFNNPSSSQQPKCIWDCFKLGDYRCIWITKGSVYTQKRSEGE